MRESRTYGSVRGALSNERPYRDIPGARFSPGYRSAHPGYGTRNDGEHRFATRLPFCNLSFLTD